MLGNRLRARYAGKQKTFDWSGKSQGRGRITDGFYSVRFTMRLDGKLRDVRRLTLERRNGVFRPAPDSAQRTGCGLMESYALSSAAFGGRSSKPLGISYRLARGADAVKIEARVGKKVVRTFKGGTARGRNYRYSLPAGLVKRGQRVKIVTTISQGAPSELPALTAKRL